MSNRFAELERIREWRREPRAAVPALCCCRSREDHCIRRYLRRRIVNQSPAVSAGRHTCFNSATQQPPRVRQTQSTRWPQVNWDTAGSAACPLSGRVRLVVYVRLVRDDALEPAACAGRTALLTEMSVVGSWAGEAAASIHVFLRRKDHHQQRLKPSVSEV